MEPTFSSVLIDIVSVQTFDIFNALLVVADPTTGGDQNAFNADLLFSVLTEFQTWRLCLKLL
jgi:hypothetical protein